MRSDIVVVGSLNVDLVTRLRRFPAPGETVTALDFAVHPGGKGANQAYAAARLGGRVSMVGAIGDDAHGRSLSESLHGAGVDVDAVERHASAPTGMALISLDASGENQIVVVPGANACLTADCLERSRSRLAAAAVVMLQLEVPLSSVEAAARVAHAGGATVILDPAPAQPLSRDLLACIHYLTPNESELETLTGHASGTQAEHAARELAAGTALKVIVKLGDVGALLVEGDRQAFWPALRVQAVDATGAGDAFNAALAVALAEGKSIAEAGRLAVAAGALCVTRAGAQPSMPTRREVEAALAK
jgi:ribokinase